MAYDETSVVDVGRLSTYDTLIKDHVETRLKDITDDIIGKNLLINADFRAPVNRNGKTEYSVSGYGAIDNWVLSENIGTANVRIGDGYITFPANGGLILSQKLGTSLSNYIYGKDVTISCMTTSDFYTNTVNVFSNTNLVDTAEVRLSDDWNIDVYGDPDNLTLRVFSQSGAIATSSVNVVAIKLEVGSTQTLAKQTETGDWELIESPDYAEQFAICSQYSPITGEYIGDQNSNTNMLDNWYLLNPVNRQNFSSVTAGLNITPFMDRWVGCRANISLSADGLSLSWNGNNADPNSGNKTGYIQQQLRYRYLEGRQYTLSAIIDGELYYATLTTPASSNSGVHSAERGGIKFGLGNLYNGYLGVSVITSSTTPRVITAIKCELGSVQTLARKNDAGNWILIDPPTNYEIEYVKCVQYDVTTGEYIGLNASAVNALSTEGGIVNGDIVIAKSATPILALQNTTESVEAKVAANDGAALLVASALDDDTNKDVLIVNRETSTLEEAVQFERVVDGESNIYNLYGEHNKPTPADIGAATENGLEEVKTTVEANYDESIIGLSVSGTTVTYIKGDGSVHTFETQDTNTTYSLGTDQETGLTKLYATMGSAEDGTMTQKAIKTELDKKVGVRLNNNTLVFTI